MATEKRMPAALFIERVLSAMTILALTCICIGLPLFMVGMSFNVFVVAQVGVYLLLIGIALIAMRILCWILEEIVGRGLEKGLESMEKKMG